MYLALASASSDPAVTRSTVLDRIASALEIQLCRDFAPLWQHAGMAVKVFGSVAAIPDEPEAAPLVVFDDPDQAGMLAYHARDPKGRPYGRAFWSVIRANGGELLRGPISLSAALSHEGVEMSADPYASWWVDLPNGLQEPLEAADRSEHDVYDVDNVAVTNILGPRAFRDGPGPFDFMRLLTWPWEIRPSGYANRREGGQITTVWGSAYPDWKKDLKMHPGGRTAQRRLAVEGLTNANA